jgi:hypothetical protein
MHMHAGALNSHSFSDSLSSGVKMSSLMFLATRGARVIIGVFTELITAVAWTMMVERVEGKPAEGTTTADPRAKSAAKAIAYCMVAVRAFLPPMLVSLFKYRGGRLYNYCGLVL